MKQGVTFASSRTEIKMVYDNTDDGVDENTNSTKKQIVIDLKASNPCNNNDGIALVYIPNFIVPNREGVIPTQGVASSINKLVFYFLVDNDDAFKQNWYKTKLADNGAVIKFTKPSAPKFFWDQLHVISKLFNPNPQQAELTAHGVHFAHQDRVFEITLCDDKKIVKHDFNGQKKGDATLGRHWLWIDLKQFDNKMLGNYFPLMVRSFTVGIAGTAKEVKIDSANDGKKNEINNQFVACKLEKEMGMCQKSSLGKNWDYC